MKSERDIQIRDEMINKVKDTIQKLGADLNHVSTKEQAEEQLIQVDVLLDTIKFLNDYEENIKVLNKHWLNKNSIERFSHSER